MKDMKEKIMWFFYPNYYDIAKIKSKNTTKIYDCVDYQKSFNKEKLLIKRVDYFFVNSQTLAKLHQNQSKKAILINAQGFFQAREDLIKKSPYKFNKAVVGFVGGINYRLDFSLIDEIVSHNPQWQFVFYGPTQKDKIFDKQFKTSTWLNKLKTYDNVLFASSEDRYQVYGVIKQFDVAIIPYNIEIPFNKYCYPMKLFEYFYFKKPVVSTEIEELKKTKFKKLLKISNNPEKFANEIKKYIIKKDSDEVEHKRKMMAIQNSWLNKLNLIQKQLNKS